MKVAGIIAEFNPFHSGHKYLIDKARELTGADYICIVMSGDFAQNGKPAFMPKELRTRMALKCGADAVFMLPVSVSTQSAAGFAYGSVSLLKHLGCIDYLCFGCEHTDIRLLHRLSDIILNEPEAVSQKIRQLTAAGMSFPLARASAIASYSEENTNIFSADKVQKALYTPNSILALEYLRSLKELGCSDIVPVAVKREGRGFSSEDISSLRNDFDFCSATAIRNLFLNNPQANEALNEILPFVPDVIHDLYKDNYKSCYPMSADYLMEWLTHLILNIEKSKLIEICDCDEFLANRIVNICSATVFNDYDSLIKALLTKNYTYNRISRVMCHLMLSFTKEHDKAELSYERCMYARLLGFKRSRKEILTRIKEKSTVPIISKPAAADDIIRAFYHDTAKSLTAENMIVRDISAGNHYQTMMCQRLGAEYKTEEQKQIITE